MSNAAVKSQVVTHGVLSAELLHMHAFASKDEAMVSLNYIMVRRRGPTLWQAVATDGHRLVAVLLPANSVASDVDKFFIPADLLRKVKLKKGDTAAFDVDDDIARVVLSGATLVERADQGIDYPEVDQVIPAPSEEHASKWGVNAEYLWDAQDYVRKVTGKKDAGIVIEAPSDDSSPMRVTCGALDGFLCIIMPMRI